MISCFTINVMLYLPNTENVKRTHQKELVVQWWIPPLPFIFLRVQTKNLWKWFISYLSKKSQNATYEINNIKFCLEVCQHISTPNPLPSLSKLVLVLPFKLSKSSLVVLWDCKIKNYLLQLNCSTKPASTQD